MFVIHQLIDVNHLRLILLHLSLVCPVDSKRLRQARRGLNVSLVPLDNDSTLSVRHMSLALLFIIFISSSGRAQHILVLLIMNRLRHLLVLNSVSEAFHAKSSVVGPSLR